MATITSELRPVLKLEKTSSFLLYIDSQISLLHSNRQWGTARNYQSAYRSLSAFLAGKDLPLRALTEPLMADYESWLRHRKASRNTISFYMRILRACYHKAVEEGIISQSPVNPFRRVYTGVDRTRKRAVAEPVVTALKTLDLKGNSTLLFARDIFFLAFTPVG